MNILFLHSGHTITGSVTYARALQHAWHHLHRVYWINDGLDRSERRGTVLALQRKLFPHGLLNALRIIAYVRHKQVQVLHAHSRQANLAAAMTSRVTGIPYVTTVHMRTKRRPANRLWPCWGNRTIAICETVERHLVEENRVAPERIRLIRNGIDLDVFRPLARGNDPETGRWITVLGRLSGKRWNAAAFLLSLVPFVTAEYPDVRFRFVGYVAPEHQEELDRWVSRLNARELLVVAVGEQASYGLMTRDTFRPAQIANFGDFPIPGSEGFDARTVLEGVRAILDHRINIHALGNWGRAQVRRDHHLGTISRQIDKVYSELRFPLDSSRVHMLPMRDLRADISPCIDRDSDPRTVHGRRSS
jgi:hypothetical protein